MSRYQFSGFTITNRRRDTSRLSSSSVARALAFPRTCVVSSHVRQLITRDTLPHREIWSTGTAIFSNLFSLEINQRLFATMSRLFCGRASNNHTVIIIQYHYGSEGEIEGNIRPRNASAKEKARKLEISGMRR